LVLAGSDSSGGAGVDADRSALAEAGVSGKFVVTAWTHQDAGGVRDLGKVSPGDWEEEARVQIRKGVGALKIGLLPGLDACRAFARVHQELPAGTPAVLDPVLASSSGTRFQLLEDVPEMLEVLAPLGLIWTPNLPELAELGGVSLSSLLEDQQARGLAASRLVEQGAAAVVVKGGHGLEDPICDLLVEPAGKTQTFPRPRLQGASMRGSGCRFASFLAAQLLLGLDLPRAVDAAGQFMGEQLKPS
jgi:hydroxymethylpyrimidine/phosphomethylpyrimidine kinase